jgi:hypothetical protein
LVGRCSFRYKWYWANFVYIHPIGWYKIKRSLHLTTQTIEVMWFNHNTKNGGRLVSLIWL